MDPSPSGFSGALLQKYWFNFLLSLILFFHLCGFVFDPNLIFFDPSPPFLGCVRTVRSRKVCPWLDLKDTRTPRQVPASRVAPPHVPRIYISTLNRALAEGPGVRRNSDHRSCQSGNASRRTSRHMHPNSCAQRTSACLWGLPQTFLLQLSCCTVIAQVPDPSNVSLFQAVSWRHLEAKLWDL